MFDVLKYRFSQGTRTIPFPPTPAQAGLPARFRGLPVLAPGKCASGCAKCADVCPTEAIKPATQAAEGKAAESMALDMGRCVYCTECVSACPEGAIAFTQDWRMAASKREDLVLRGSPDEPHLARALEQKMRKLFGRSLKLRQVSAGGCSGCEGELVATGNIIFDIGRFGMQFVASPRHADGIVVTGPVTENMRAALLTTYEAVPAPKIVVAVGACAIAGGPFYDSSIVAGGAAAVLPVDLFIPGCPPHPLTVLDGFLRMLGKIESGERPPGVKS